MGDTVDEELPPSKLGTKEHWDMVYQWVIFVHEKAMAAWRNGCRAGKLGRRRC